MFLVLSQYCPAARTTSYFSATLLWKKILVQIVTIYLTLSSSLTCFGTLIITSVTITMGSTLFVLFSLCISGFLMYCPI